MKNEFETIAENMGYSVVKVDGNYLNPNVTVLENGYMAGRNSRDEEIKKLREALRKIGNKLLFRDGCVDIMYIIEEALKEMPNV